MLDKTSKLELQVIKNRLMAMIYEQAQRKL